MRSFFLILGKGLRRLLDRSVRHSSVSTFNIFFCNGWSCDENSNSLSRLNWELTHSIMTNIRKQSRKGDIFDEIFMRYQSTSGKISVSVPEIAWNWKCFVNFWCQKNRTASCSQVFFGDIVQINNFSTETTSRQSYERILFKHNLVHLFFCIYRCSYIRVVTACTKHWCTYF